MQKTQKDEKQFSKEVGRNSNFHKPVLKKIMTTHAIWVISELLSDKKVKIRLMIKFEFSKLKQVISMTQHFYVEVY